MPHGLSLECFRRRRASSMVLYDVYESIVIPPILFLSNGFHWGTSFLFLAAHTLKGTGEKKRSNTLKGTGEKKAPPRRVGLGSMHDRLFAAEVFAHEARFTSMGRPHCGLPPFAQPKRPTADAIMHGMKCSLTRISPCGHRPTLNGRGAVPCSDG